VACDLNPSGGTRRKIANRGHHFHQVTPPGQRIDARLLEAPTKNTGSLANWTTVTLT